VRRLADAHEHLDGGLTDAGVLRDNLRDLRRINRLFGGTRLSLTAVRVLAGPAGGAAPPPDRPFRILDVGTGAADIPMAMVGASGPWPSVELTAIDSRAEVLAAARSLDPRLASTPGLELVLGDGFDLPFADGSFDVGHASLVLHHLEPVAARRFLEELRRVSTRGVVINDLARSRLGWVGAWILLHLMTSNRFTLHDGPLSVRRSYTRAEARDLLADAGLRPVAEYGGFAGHRWAIAAVPESGS
jgi:ubiquinone/menaquinone biosynthesis C-methylase UbiE